MSVFCPKCGSVVEDGAMFCEKCGQSIGNLTRPSAPAQQGGTYTGASGTPRGSAPAQQGGYVSPASRPSGTAPAGYTQQGAPAGYAQQPYPQGQAYRQGYPQGQPYGQGAPQRQPYPQPQGQAGYSQGYYGQAGQAPAKVKKPFNKKLLIPIIGGPILVAAAVILLIIFLGGSSGYQYYKPTLSYYYDSNEDSYFLVNADGTFTKPQDDIVGLSITADGKKIFYSTREGGLYVYDGTSTRIDSGDSFDFALTSFDGSAAVYKMDDSIMYWSASNKTRIMPEVEYVSGLCISPDGSSVGFAVEEEDGGSRVMVGYVWDGKNLEKLGRGIEVVAVSNGLGKIYLTSEKSNKLYVQNGTDESTRMPLCSTEDYSTLLFNKDLSAFLTMEGNKDSRLYINGEEIRLSERVDTLVNIKETQGTGFVGLYFNSSRNGRSAVLNRDSFKGLTFVSSDGGIYKIDDKYEAQRVSSRNDSSNTAVEDGDQIYCRTSNYKLEVSQFNSSTSSYDSEFLCDEEMSQYWLLGKNRAIVMENSGSCGELHLREGSGEKVNDLYLGECDLGGYRSVAFSNGTLFYILDKELYSTSGDKGVRNKQFDSVISVEALPNGVLVVGVGDDYDRDLYTSTNGTDFVKQN